VAKTENTKRNPLFFEVPVAEMSKWLPSTFSFRVSGFKDSRCSGGVTPLSFEFLVAEMPKWLPGAFSFRISGFGDSQCSGGVTPLSFEVSVAKMQNGSRALFHFVFRVSGIPDAVEE
jgi:hypothetical protein